jgi:hypothetical protein
MRRLPSVVAAALGIAALTSTVTIAAAGPGGFGLPRNASPLAGWHYDHGLLISNRHVMPPRGHQRPRPNLCCTQLVYNGGPLQRTPSVFLTFWGWTSDPNGEGNYLFRFLNGVGSYSWLATLYQYGMGNPRHQLVAAHIFHDSTPIPSSPTDAQIAQEAINTASHFGISDPNASYVIATPSGHSTAGFGSSFCAYHGSVADGGTALAYTNLPYMTDAGGNCGEFIVNPSTTKDGGGLLDGVSIVEGHELAETQTDPQPPSGWYNGSYGEIGDMCAWQILSNIELTNGTFAVQPLFSNNASDFTGNCVVGYP